MRIAYIINSLRKSGPVNVLYNIVTHLPAGQYDLHIIKLSEDEVARSITDRFEDLGIKVWPLHCSKMELEMHTGKVAKAVSQIVDRISPDIIHTHGYHPALIAAHLQQCPRIETLHCICWEDFIYSKGLLLGKWMIFRYVRALRRLDGYACISDAVRSAYEQKGLRQEKLWTAPNGCDDNLFCPLDAPQKQALRKTLGLPEAEKLFTVVGSLSLRKDCLTVVRAFANANLDGKASLVFVGKGPLMEQCRREAAGHENILFTGFQMNANDYLKAADWSICASHSEGFGLNFVEALLCGIPVIGTNIPPFREFTAYAPELRSLEFSPGNTAGLTDSILRSLTTDIDMTQIRESIVERYSARRMGEHYANIYHRVIGS